ncbi:MAG: hypothetical protein LAO05_10415 [Acidobacteriia bacterium]|nr:hypothetical protein [Terriglobia bacterium]
MHDAPRRRSRAPLIAATLALAYLAAVAVGAWALAGVAVAAAVAGCAAVLTRRPSAGLRLGLGAIMVWLALGIGGAFVLHPHAIRGFVWVLLVLYFVPLPLVPWLYAATFAETKIKGRREKVDGRGKTSDLHDGGLSSSLSPLPSNQTEGGQ